MSMIEWAENEVRIACERENPNRKEGEFDYGCACYESALKAYKCLCEDGHKLIKGNYEHQICFAHDDSKSNQDEYEAYDAYFYGNNRSYSVIQNFKVAWLNHIHRNPHHWQYWIFVNDDPNEGEILLEIPYNYIIEMICDWWAFSWEKRNLREIFDWYNQHKDYMKLNGKTRDTVEDILSKIKKKLEENKDD